MIGLVGALAVLPAPPATARSSGTVTVKFYDQRGQGTELTPAEARRVMRGGNGWDSDALVRPSDLQDVAQYPLYRTGSALRFDLPGRPVALSVAWPDASQGYSNVIMDNRGRGFASTATVVFNQQAAIDAKRRLDRALAARPGYVRSAAFDAAYAQATSELAHARASSTDRARGRFGQRALDAVHRANDALLSEYGPAFAHSAPASPWIGLTVDDPDVHPLWPALAAELTQPHGWVRLVFDPTADGGDPAYYADAVADADAAGLRILGEPIDSAFANSFTRREYLERFRDYVDAFPQVDAWEVGNEVNGCWVDSVTTAGGRCTSQLLPARDRIRNKVADAAAYVNEARPEAEVVVTLYWQIGTDAARWSTFNWARANLPDALRDRIDVILLSQYVEDAPMGLAFDQVFRALGAEFPGQRIGLGELDYWSADTSRVWWAFDEARPPAARRELAAHYYAASLGYPNSVGGGFWWYFPTEVPGDELLQEAIRGVVDRTVGG